MDESVRRGQSVLGTAIKLADLVEIVLGTTINRVSRMVNLTAGFT